MKIIFLCGSMEPGRDGVGDYTRRLAVEMIGQGHQVAVIGLKDWYITNCIECMQHSENIDLKVLRIPFIWPSKDRFERAKAFIDLFDPDWLSLQFVNFSFQQKGLHFGLSKKLAEIGKGRKWHIMFHELWLGMSDEASMKHILWGKAQQSMIKNLIVRLRPASIHTQSRLYMQHLTKLGFKVDYLPLFSNIPRHKVPIERKNKLQTSKTTNKNSISFVLFGSVHPSSPVEEFAKEAAEYSLENKIMISIIFIGRGGDEVGHWASVLKSYGLKVELLGEQAPERISEILANSFMGISTSSLAYIEKSGTVAAMREHGLPIICVSRPLRLNKFDNLIPMNGIIEYKVGNFKDCIKIKLDFSMDNLISEVSNIMTIDFQDKMN